VPPWPPRSDSDREAGPRLARGRGGAHRAAARRAGKDDDGRHPLPRGSVAPDAGVPGCSPPTMRSAPLPITSANRTRLLGRASASATLLPIGRHRGPDATTPRGCVRGDRLRALSGSRSIDRRMDSPLRTRRGGGEGEGDPRCCRRESGGAGRSHRRKRPTWLSAHHPLRHSWPGACRTGSEEHGAHLGARVPIAFMEVASWGPLRTGPPPRGRATSAPPSEGSSPRRGSTGYTSAVSRCGQWARHRTAAPQASAVGALPPGTGTTDSGPSGRETASRAKPRTRAASVRA
jgi:hypothetical protein